MTEPKRLVRRLLPGVLLLVLLLALAPIFGKILERVPNYVWVGQGALGLVCSVAWGLLLRPRREKRFLGDVAKQPFMLEPGETRVFGSYYRVGALLYLRAGDYSPRARIRRVISEKKRLLGDPYLRVWLTDRRLMLESQLGNTWRIIPITNIERVTEPPRRFFFSPSRVVIRYNFEGHGEVLDIEDKSVIGKTLKEALLSLNLLSA